MPLCPVHAGVEVLGPCSVLSCYNYVPTLDYSCLKLHCEIYNRSTSDVLTSLYGKGYKMTSALAIKATRVAFVMKDLSPEPDRIMLGFESSWVSRLKKGGPLNSKMHWTEMTKRNEGLMFIDRMSQVLNTMEVYDYKLKNLLTSYATIFPNIDLAAFALRKEDEEAAEQLLRSEI